jgi:hypothetical protein
MSETYLKSDHFTGVDQRPLGRPASPNRCRKTFFTADLWATSHLTQSSSASRFTAGCFGFLLLTQCRERPEAWGEPSRLQAWHTAWPSLNEDRQRYTNCNHIFLRLWCPHGVIDIRARGSLLLADELCRPLAQFDQHLNRNSSLLEQVQGNYRYRCKSECAGAQARAEALAGAEALAPC